jgi:hypothetical protein
MMSSLLTPIHLQLAGSFFILCFGNDGRLLLLLLETLDIIPHNWNWNNAIYTLTQYHDSPTCPDGPRPLGGSYMHFQFLYSPPSSGVDAQSIIHRSFLHCRRTNNNNNRKQQQ